MRAERFYADTNTIAVEDGPIPGPGVEGWAEGETLATLVSRVGIEKLESQQGNPIRILVKP